MAFRFLHMADVHLDTPFKSRNTAVRNLLRDSIRQAFKASVDLAVSSGVHAILIAGDLYDNDTLSFTTEKFLLQQFQRLNEAGVDVFYTPGNHDPSGSIYRLKHIKWPANVHVFEKSKPEQYRVQNKYGEVVAVINGAGHESRKEGRNLVKDFPEADGDIPHIGIVHALVGGVNGSSEHERYAPCSLADIQEKGYKYWALGHIHKRAELLSEPFVIYPGNLVGRNPAETGPRGAYLVEIDSRGRVNTNFYPLSPVTWETVYVDDLHDMEDLSSLEHKIFTFVSEQLESKNSSKNTLLRIILEGPCPLYSELHDEENIAVLEEGLKVSLNVDFLELETGSIIRPVNPEKYRDEPHVLSTALSVLDTLKLDSELLLKLMENEKLGGCPLVNGYEEKAEYLRTLLEGLDYEIVHRLVGGEER